MRLRGLLVLGATALAGCAHTEPFQPLDTSTNRPFLPGTPVRLTYNPGADLRPAWLPDGSAFVYAWQQYNQSDKDRCLSFLEVSGGSRFDTICNPDPFAVDSADLFDSPSPSPNGEILYARSSSRLGAPAPEHGGVFFGTLADPLSATKVLNLPYGIPGGRIHGAISTARWLSARSLVYIGQSANYAREFLGCPLDTVVTGLEVVAMNLSGAQPELAVIPFTDGASSIALTAGRDTLYFTLNGDSKVYRLELATGQVSIAHDFGALGIARDVTVLGARLVAVVGGEIEFTEGTLGPLQFDGGGNLVSVDLATGAETQLPVDHPMVFRKPEFAPAGDRVRLVVEGLPVGTLSGGCDWHELLSKVGDLYLYEAP